MSEWNDIAWPDPILLMKGVDPMNDTYRAWWVVSDPSHPSNQAPEAVVHLDDAPVPEVAAEPAPAADDAADAAAGPG